MPPRKEICRNFQRGSCHYGDRCKFLHAAPLQSKPNNPFGFGVQNGNSFQGLNQQQQMPNPFGFGSQNNTQSRGSSDYASKTTQPKLFENKWTRSDNKQNADQPQVADHKCNDPELCKRVIMDDLKSENPQWVLSCYGHCRYGHCDITGDISYEELRAVAYDDAKSAKSLQFIIERERSLVNSKIAEFKSLEQRTHPVSSFGFTSSSFPSVNISSSTPALGFSQFGQPQNAGSRTATAYTFGQPSQFSNNQAFGGFGSQLPQTSVQTTAFQFGPTNFGNVETTARSNAFSTFGSPSILGNVSNIQSPVAAAIEITPSISLQLNDLTSGVGKNVDEGIWTKLWKAGEVPEEAPPDIYIH